MSLAVGDLVAVPLPNGVFGVIWIRGVAMRQISFVVLDGFWDAAPKRVKLRLMPQPLRDEPEELYENVYQGSFAGKLPKDFVVVDNRELTPEVLGLDYGGTYCLQNGESLRGALYDQWRWLHDREQLQAEWDKSYADYQAREAERRAQQTLPRMLRERPFAHWPSKKLAREAQRIFKEATRELIRLQKGEMRSERVAVLKRITTELNAFDDAAGGIESMERDEIVARVDQLAALVEITNENEELTGHRDW